MDDKEHIAHELPSHDTKQYRSFGNAFFLIFIILLLIQTYPMLVFRYVRQNVPDFVEYRSPVSCHTQIYMGYGWKMTSTEVMQPKDFFDKVFPLHLSSKI